MRTSVSEDGYATHPSSGLVTQFYAKFGRAINSGGNTTITVPKFSTIIGVVDRSVVPYKQLVVYFTSPIDLGTNAFP